MSTVTLKNYLFFTQSKTREAMQFYQSVFGGELTFNTYGEMGGEQSEEMKDKIMHSELTGGEITLMASDSSTREHFEDSFISLSLHSSDESKLRNLYDKLAVGGKNLEPISKQPWGMFGSLTDKYNVDWMFNGESNQ